MLKQPHHVDLSTCAMRCLHRRDHRDQSESLSDDALSTEISVMSVSDVTD